MKYQLFHSKAVSFIRIDSVKWCFSWENYPTKTMENKCFWMFLNVFECFWMFLNVFENSTSKQGILNVTNKMGNEELHRLRNWFWNSLDIEIFSEPIVLEFHFLEKFQLIVYEASNYSMLPFDIDDNDSIFSSFLLCIQRWFLVSFDAIDYFVFVLSKKSFLSRINSL